MPPNAALSSEGIDIDADGQVVTHRGAAGLWQTVLSDAVFAAGHGDDAVHLEVDVRHEGAVSSNAWRLVVGVAPADFQARGRVAQRWLGAQGSWGLVAATGAIVGPGAGAAGEVFGTPFGAGSTIGIVLDFAAGTIAFSHNGVTLGVAFRNLAGPVRLAVSMTARDSRVQLWRAK